MYLNDKLPDADVKADPFSIEALCAWLRTKPADEVYCWEDGGQCLFGQYGRFLGIEHPIYLTVVQSFRDGLHLEQCIAWLHPRTFGAALLRAEKLLSGT